MGETGGLWGWWGLWLGGRASSGEGESSWGGGDAWLLESVGRLLVVGKEPLVVGMESLVVGTKPLVALAGPLVVRVRPLAGAVEPAASFLLSHSFIFYTCIRAVGLYWSLSQLS